MSLNDKARAALRRELAKCFPERAANDPGHAKLAAALSDTAHTPGPWHVTHEPTLSTYHVRVEDIDRAPIASLFYSSGGARPVLSRELVDANARLIAAAPELLEACKQMLARLGSLSAESANMMLSEDADNLNMGAVYLRNAIAKAEGGAK